MVIFKRPPRKPPYGIYLSTLLLVIVVLLKYTVLYHTSLGHGLVLCALALVFLAIGLRHTE